MEKLFDRFILAIDFIKNDLDKGINEGDLVKTLGTNDNTFKKYLNKQGLLKSEVLYNLVHLYNINPMWLFRGEGEPFPGAIKKYPEVCGPLKSSASDESQAGEFFFIPPLRYGRQMESGQKGKISLHMDWIKHRGDLDRLMLIKVSGDAMAPTLLPGDLLIMDSSITDVSPEGGLFAISCADSEIMIRRLQLMLQDKKMKIISDNKRYEPIEADRGQVVISGKVIWVARNIDR